jgi:hypothetical protein
MIKNGYKKSWPVVEIYPGGGRRERSRSPEVGIHSPDHRLGVGKGRRGMTRDELLALIAEVQSKRSELDTVEVKTAKGRTPKRLYESLSAFANRPGGGVIILDFS